MTEKPNASRRNCLIKLVQVAAAIPLAGVAAHAMAAKNDALRKSLQYQDTPKDGKDCKACAQFVPGASATAKGTCKIIPNDDEISPSGWCTAFVQKK
ncbi:MAG TPA: high-potential iron-sulfur protein [Rhodocyclaceae bacterium]|jgi:hypothetical protein|nr:high-potential iron-sulfur protein [Rhodocyclaceae bacterium]